MTFRKTLSALLIAFVVALHFTPISVATAADYKVGDDCSRASGVEYISVEEYRQKISAGNLNGLWCFNEENGKSTYQNIPVELDESEIDLLVERIEQIVSVDTKTRSECEKFGIKETKKILMEDLRFTAAQDSDILSCNTVEVWSGEPPNSTWDTCRYVLHIRHCRLNNSSDSHLYLIHPWLKIEAFLEQP